MRDSRIARLACFRRLCLGTKGGRGCSRSALARRSYEATVQRLAAMPVDSQFEKDKEGAAEQIRQRLKRAARKQHH